MVQCNTTFGTSEGCFIVFNPLDCTTFKLTHFIDGVSGSSFWTYLLRTSSHFYVIPEVLLPETFSTSIDLISTIMINNNPFHVRIEADGGKFGFTVVLTLLLYFGNDFNLKVFGKNCVEKNFLDVDVDVALVPPIDAVNEIYEEPHSRVYRFSRTVGTDFMLPDRVSEMAKLNICLKDITVRLLNLEPPVQFTNGTRRERTHNGFRYALKRWSKFMKTVGIKYMSFVNLSTPETFNIDVTIIDLIYTISISNKTFDVRIETANEMEQAAITLLNNVDLNVDDYTIRIRIVRLWTRPSFNNPRKVYCYDMIFMDQEGTKMQAFVLQKNTTAYEHLLKENQCLTIRNPSLRENRQKVKYVHSSFKINLNETTIVEQSAEPVGAEWGFDFSPFESVVEDPDNDGKSFKSPIDVIGFVVKCLPSEEKTENNNGKDEKKATFILEDLQHQQIYVTLWGVYADQIIEFQRKHKDEKNVVVVVQFGKYRFWGGNLFVSNLYTVTRVFINTEIPEILEFKRSFLAQLNTSTSSGYSGLSSPVMKSMAEEYLSDISFSTIGALSGISEEKFVIILGTIKSFASEDSWFYNACKTSNKKVFTNTISKAKEDGSEGYDEVTVLECQTDRCNKRIVVSVPRIKLPIRVQDCNGIVTLTLFEREVVKLLNVNANQLLDNNMELASEGNFPSELKALINKRFAFKIAIGSFNIQKKSDGYSVSKLTENPSIIKDLDTHFDVYQAADEEPLDPVASDPNPIVNVNIRDSVSRVVDEDTPMSNLNNSIFTTPSGAHNSCSSKMLDNELKRNLEAVYDVDLCSSQSSTKPRQGDCENNEGLKMKAKLENYY
ncbi:putative replication protein A, OB [Helianthus annuus]|nr:putative replication protein A, OB [Helianthus annuus]